MQNHQFSSSPPTPIGMNEPLSDDEYYLAQIPKPKGPRPLKTIGKTIPSVLRRYGLTEQQASIELQKVWESIVEPMLVPDTRLGHIQRGILLVLVKNGLVLQELSMRKPEILARFKEFPATQKITGIRFRMEEF